MLAPACVCAVAVTVLATAAAAAKTAKTAAKSAFDDGGPQLKTSLGRMAKLMLPLRDDLAGAEAVLDVFREADRHLMEQSKYSEFERDLERVDRLLQAELGLSKRRNLKRLLLFKRPARSSARLSALARLDYLAATAATNLTAACSAPVMRNIVEVNAAARDPVHRLLRFRRSQHGGLVELRRLDYHIVEAARRRARRCDAKFKAREAKGEPELDLVAEHFDRQAARLFGGGSDGSGGSGGSGGPSRPGADRKGKAVSFAR